MTQTSISYPKSNSPWLVIHFSTHSMPEGIAKNKTHETISSNPKNLKRERKGEPPSNLQRSHTKNITRLLHTLKGGVGGQQLTQHYVNKRKSICFYVFDFYLYLKFSLERQKHDFFLYGLTAGVLGNDELLAVELLEVMAYASASEDLLKEITYEFFEGDWMSSWEASLAVTGTGKKKTMNYFQTRMQMNAAFCGKEYSYSLTAFV